MRRFIWKWLRWLAIGLAVLSVALTIFVTLTPQGQAGFQTALFVTQVLGLPVKPQSWFTADPVREAVTYPQAQGTGVADLYRIPDDKERAAVLIFLGANAAGRDDEDVVNLGNALARAGFVAMFHWSPMMALQHNIDPNEIENLIWAFQYLEQRDFVDQDRVGMGGFCVGASFALVAASDSRIKDDVAFVNAFGPYYDARDLLLQVASRSRYYQDQTDPWNPDSMTRKVFANELIEAMDDPQSRDILSRIFVEKQRVADEEVEGLSDQARAVHQLLTGTTREEAERLYLTLPADFREDMAEISPRSYVSDLEARIMIMHDRDDDLVPSAESRRLADALESRGDFRYTEVLAFDHVRPTSGGGLGSLLKEGYKLFKHMYGIVRVAT